MMGLLNFLKKNKENSEERPSLNSNKIIDDNHTNNNLNINENYNSKFRLVIQDIFTIEGKGCVVVGMLKNNTIHKGDAVYVIKKDGTTLKSSIKGIEIYKKGISEAADPEQNISVFIQDLEPDELNIGDVLVGASDNIFTKKSIDNNNEDDVILEKVFNQNQYRENGILTDNNKNDLGTIVFQTNIKEDMLKQLTVQECIFILKSLENLNKKSPLSNYNENVKVVYDVIINKIRTSNSLFILMDKATQQPFIGTGYAEIYSTKYLADMAIKHYEETYRQLYTEEFSQEGTERIKSNLFAFLFLLGMENILIDNGAYSIEIKRSEVLPPPNWSDLDPINVPLTNPTLRIAVNTYLAEARWAVDYPDREKNLNDKENNMLSELKKGKFLIPIKSNVKENKEGNELEIKNGDTISFALITNSQEETYLPLFTDWLEFEKAYSPDEWKGMIISIKEVLPITKDNKGFVINPFGENLIISNELSEQIFKDLI